MSLTYLPKVKYAKGNQLFLIAGPCVLEGEEMSFRIAEKIKSITDVLSVPFIFKGSFKKANRSRLDSFTGRGIPVMKKFAPVVLDITHSLQQPNQINGITGGRPENIEIIARATVASGVDGVFLGTHFNTSIAKSDGSNMLELEHLDGLLARLTKLRSFIKERL